MVDVTLHGVITRKYGLFVTSCPLLYLLPKFIPRTQSKSPNEKRKSPEHGTVF